MRDVVVKQLSVYPVKACQGSSVDQVRVTADGIVGDRGFVLWQDGNLVDQKETPATASLAVSWDEPARRLVFRHAVKGEYVHAVREQGEVRAAQWVLDAFETCDQGDEVAQWLSGAIGKSVRLVSPRRPWKKNLPLAEFERVHGQPTSRFYSASPVSLSNLASLDAVNGHLDAPVPMDRFRMNVVVDGLDAWAEDDIDAISSPSVTLTRITHCERCIITTTDQQTGERGSGDLLAVLRKHRYREQRFGSGLLFGAYMAVAREGVLRVGDRLTVEAV